MGIFGFFSKEKKESLDQGLQKTSESIFSKLSKAVVGKSKVDEEVLDELEEVITRLTDEAIAAVQQVPFAQSVRDELITLAEYVSWRTV